MLNHMITELLASGNGHSHSDLREAVLSNQHDIARLLIEHGADVNAKDKYGTTPISEATLQGHFDIVRLLLENGAVDVTTQYGNSLLELAVVRGSSDVENILAEDTDYNTEQDVQDANNRCFALLSLLLDHGAKIATKQAMGKRVLDMYRYASATPVVIALLNEHLDQF